jgi:hypothetical protein
VARRRSTRSNSSSSFAISYAALCVAQGATVALPAPQRFQRLSRLASRWWAALPLIAIVATVFGIGAESETADALTYLALVTTPPLAAAAAGYAIRGARPPLALLVIPATAAAWALKGSLTGEIATLALVAAACVTLAALLRAVASLAWLKAGLLVMALADAILVANDTLQAPNAVLNAAAPAGGLPQLQRVVLGSAVMGYGDVFAAALLGAILATRPRRQNAAALLTTALAIAFGTLFFAIDELPATVPVAGALLVSEALDRRRRKLSRSDGAAADHRLVRLHMTLLLRRPREGRVARAPVRRADRVAPVRPAPRVPA